MALIVISSATTLIGCELFLAAFFPQLSPLTRGGFLQADSRLGWSLRPGARTDDEFEVSINRLGLRDRELGEKSANDFRVLMIGDSFTFGTVRSDDTFVKQLEVEDAGRDRPVEREMAPHSALL